jgi:hypothetical protein
LELKKTMHKYKLPNKRAMNNDVFRKRGWRDVVLIEVLPIHDGDVLKLTFESTNSPWRQGVWLMTDEYVVINQIRCPGADLWQDTAPKRVLIECHTKSGYLHLYNIWDDGQGRDSQSHTSGMLVEELPKGRRYRCNDFGFDTKFDKLVFRIERVRAGKPIKQLSKTKKATATKSRKK